MANFTTPPVWYDTGRNQINMFYNQTALNICIGSNNTVANGDSIAIGNNSKARGFSQIALGGANVDQTEGQYVARIFDKEQTAKLYVGNREALLGETNDNNLTILGSAGGKNGIAIGWGSYSLQGSIAIGYQAITRQENCVQLLNSDIQNAKLYVGNKEALLVETNSVSIGYNKNVTILGSTIGEYGIAIGQESFAQSGSVAIGYKAKSNSWNEVRLLGNDVSGATLYVGNTKMASEEAVSTNKSYINILKGKVNDIIEELATRFQATNIRNMKIKDTEIPQ